jgi:hypothetical protein
MASHGGTTGISVYSDDDMKALVADYSKWFNDAATDLSNLAPALHRRIVRTMKGEGVGGKLGLSERNAAARVCNPLADAAERCDHAARAIILAGRRWETNFIDPIHAARRAATGHDTIRV